MIYSVAKMQDQVRTAVVTDFYTVQFVWLQILGSSLGNYLHPRNFIIFLSAIKIIDQIQEMANLPYVASYGLMKRVVKKGSLINIQNPLEIS